MDRQKLKYPVRGRRPPGFPSDWTNCCANKHRHRNHAVGIRAYPALPTTTQIVTQWPGRSAEEIEPQVTVPVEIQMGGIPHLTNLRSTTLVGLWSLMLIFDDNSTGDLNRAHVVERLGQISLPANLTPQMGTD